MSQDFTNPLSERMATIIEQGCVVSAKRQNRRIIHPRDLLLTILDDATGLAFNILDVAGVSVPDLKKDIANFKVEKDESKGKVQMHPYTKHILNRADKIASKLGHNVVGTEHVVLAFLSYTGRDEKLRRYKSMFKEYGITSKIFQDGVLNYLSASSLDGTETESKSQKKEQKKKEEDSKVHNFIKNLNKKVLEDSEPFIGREEELERLISVISRKKKNNVIIVGDEGVGKTALAEGLARKIVEGSVPSNVADSVIFSLDIGGIVAGTKFRGQFEERMKQVLEFFGDKNQGFKPILFIDEIHQIISAGSAEGALDANALLKPGLANGDIQCIGTTTMKEYKKYILTDGPLARRFSPVILDEPSTEDTKKILDGIKEEYEEYHKVEVDEFCIDKIVKLCDRYIRNRNFPDKAIDILDESCVRKTMDKMKSKDISDAEDKITKLRFEIEDNKKSQKFEKCAELVKKRDSLVEKLSKLKDEHKKLDEETITRVISDFTGIPLGDNSELERERLLNMESCLSSVIVNQQEAIKKVSNAVQRSRAGLKDPDRPSGVFLFLGETGTGKTLLAKQLARFMFGDEKKLLRLDMSEYMEKTSASKIIGSPPGFVGYEDDGRLVDQVRTKPYCVILLDEIEKAHPDVKNVFLQVFDEGRLTDSRGETTDFRNTIIIMTSNIGVGKLKKSSVGFQSLGREEIKKEKKDILTKAVKDAFSPEFFNRIDDVVVFNSHDEDAIERIFEIEFSRLNGRLKDRKVYLECSKEAKDFLLKKGFDEKYGARPMKRAIETHVGNEVAIRIISGQIKSDEKVRVVVDSEDPDKLDFFQV